MAQILVVDDVEDARLLVRAALEPAGMHVTEAASGSQALDLLDSGADFAAMLLDVRMPGLSGWEVLDEMRERSHLSRVPVIVFTAHAGSATAERALSAGAVAYLEKPYRLDELINVVTEHAGPHGAAS